MDANELKGRTKEFALRVVRLSRAMPKTEEARVVMRQMLRSGTSVGANYRACCRARSRAEFVSKMSVTLEEADETAYWLEMIVEGQIMKGELIQPLLDECNELVAIFNSSRYSAKRNG